MERERREGWRWEATNTPKGGIARFRERAALEKIVIDCKWKQSGSLGVIGSSDWLIFLLHTPTYLFSLQLPRQILLVDELGQVKRTGFLPIIFSAYLVDLSLDTTVLWQLKHCNIRTSWNRLRAFIKAIWKPHVGDVGEPVQIRKWMQTFAILCSKLKSSGVLGCRTVDTAGGIWESSPCRILEVEVVVLWDRWMAKASRINTFSFSYWEDHYCPTGSLWHSSCPIPPTLNLCPRSVFLLGRNWSLLVILWLGNQILFIFLGGSLDGFSVRLEVNPVGS